MRFQCAIPWGVALCCCLWGAEVAELRPDAPIERGISGGETHAYRVQLTAGQYVRVTADRLDNLYNVRIDAFSPDGSPLTAVDMYPDALSVLVVADTTGAYRFEIKPASNDAGKSHYRIAICELRPATPEDRARIEIQDLFAEGRALEAKGTAASYGQALDKFQQAAGRWHAAGDRWYEAAARNEMGRIGYFTGKPQQALPELRAAADLWTAPGDIGLKADALNTIGSIYQNLGDAGQALEYTRQALDLNRANGDRAAQGAVLGNLGIIYLDLGRKQEALDVFSQALALKRAIGDHAGEAPVLYNLSLVSYSEGDNQKALDELTQSLRIAREAGDRRFTALDLSQLGVVYARLGDLERAMNCYSEALPISHEIGDPLGEAVTLLHIGNLRRMMGKPKEALEPLERALTITRDSHRRQTEALARIQIGNAYASLGDTTKALAAYNQALELHRADAYLEGEVVALARMGPLYATAGDSTKAAECFGEALTLSRTLGDKPNEALTLLGQAHLRRGLGDLDGARSSLELAIPIVESVRTKIDSSDLRVSYFASSQSYYEAYIDVLMRLGRTAAAFETAERARARGLLETLNEANADIRQGADPGLLGQERSLGQQIDAADRRRIQLLSRKDRAGQAAAVEKELSALLAEYQDVRARIRAGSPRYAALTEAQPLPINEIQQQVVDKDTLLLEYALGEDRSYLWAVTASSVEGFELPGRAEVESSAKRAYELLTANKREFQSQTDSALANLGRVLLAPVAARLEKNRLLIVADGALQYIPFEALPIGSEPLIASHEIVSLPSASVLALLRRETASRKSASKTVAVLSDPVFEKDDPRVRPSPANAGAHGAADGAAMPAAEASRSAPELGLARFERLPFSRQEAESIERFATPGKTLKAVDFNASRATAISPEIGRFRIVHFATHGLVNSQHPELSGIVLSLVDQQGRPQDGFLRIHDIYNLKLGAGLVVLSACQTALGKDIKGEGLVGLTRGFMYAGAPRVVASLWDVRDEATAELMRRFYQGMLKENLRPAAALREAQLSMWKDPRWRAPHDWAAFILQGEWR